MLRWFTALSLVLPFLMHSTCYAAHGTTYYTEITSLNDSGVSGFVSIEIDSTATMANITVNATGLEPDQPHMMHIHGAFDGTGAPADSTIPTLAVDADGDGFIEVLEGVNTYGDIILGLEAQTTSTGTFGYNTTIDLDDASNFFSPVTSTDYDRDDFLPITLREFVIHGMSTTAADGVGTGGEVDGTAGYKGLLPVGAGEFVQVPEPATSAMLATAACTALLVWRRKTS